MKKILGFLMVFASFVAVIGCTGEDAGVDIDADPNISAELDVMVWAGDGERHLDIGHQDWDSADLTAINVAALYAVAKEFNKTYPNVKINLYAKANDPTDWGQELINYNALYNKYPDVWATDSVIRDMKNGLVLDLNLFKEDALYKKMNPSLLEMTNYYGFQAALPQYTIPWGCFINRDLADQKGITVPDFDWTWQEYTNFVTSADPAQSYYGSWDASMDILRWTFIERQLMEGETDGKYVSINTPEFKTALNSLTPQSEKAVVSLAGRDELGRDPLWSYYEFAYGNTLTLTTDPWMMGWSNIDGDPTEILSDDWDIYPLPNVANKGNFIAAVYDPMVVYNHCGTDGSCSDKEKNKAKIAYRFAAFWAADTASWEARAEQEYSSDPDDPTVRASALNDSFPMVTGEDFDDQMEVWYSTTGHAPYADATRFPGFAEVINHWTEGNISSVSGKAFPLFYTDEAGIELECLDPITNFGTPSYAGDLLINNSRWAGTYKAYIPDYETTINNNFTKAFDQLKAAMKQYYGYEDADFVKE